MKRCIVKDITEAFIIKRLFFKIYGESFPIIVTVSVREHCDGFTFIQCYFLRDYSQLLGPN